MRERPHASYLFGTQVETMFSSTAFIVKYNQNIQQQHMTHGTTDVKVHHVSEGVVTWGTLNLTPKLFFDETKSATRWMIPWPTHTMNTFETQEWKSDEFVLR